jgi:hypothetical protein
MREGIGNTYTIQMVYNDFTEPLRITEDILEPLRITAQKIG